MKPKAIRSMLALALLIGLGTGRDAGSPHRWQRSWSPRPSRTNSRMVAKCSLG